ncbi:MAG: hypothetical protein ACXVCV_16920 [Polyangia bacterium]
MQNSNGHSGIVSFVSVTSDRVPDVSSIEAWKSSFLHDGMSDADKAQAVWRSVVAFRHQDEPPRELMRLDGHVHDPIKLFNVYGYSQCDCAAAAVTALGRAAGLSARGRSLLGHSVAELSFDGGWHMFDAAYIDQFPEPDGRIAHVDDLVAAVSGWLTAHPDLAGNRAALLAKMADGSWRDGPALLAASPYYSANGLFPAHVQGWADSISDYAQPSAVTEFGYTLGYRVDVQLRQGERLTRNWSNDGHHINDDLGLACDSVTGVVGSGALAYSPGYGDLAPGRVGNGTHEYTLPLGAGAYRDGVLVADNLADAVADDPGPAVRVADAGRSGVLVFRMPSSYVVLGGALTLTARVAAGGRIDLSFSRNHGVDWTPVASISVTGEQTIDLTPFVRRLYDYRIRVELVGAGTGIDALAVRDVIQHSQRALPALDSGDNQIQFSAGPDEGTITLEAGTDSSQTRNLVYTELHPIVDGLVDAPLHPTGASGSITFPVTTPGNLVRLRFGSSYRARGAADRWDYQVSFDGGQSFVPVDAAVGPTVGDERFVTFTQIPPNTQQALVRFAGTQSNTLNLFDFRIDADYAEPRGGFAPVRVTYVWDEDGQTRTDMHVAASPAATYTIHCDGKPHMRSLVVERDP